jgi:hypothetical protein
VVKDSNASVDTVATVFEFALAINADSVVDVAGGSLFSVLCSLSFLVPTPRS